MIAAMGPGEISQGMAFARHVNKKGAQVIFAVTHKDNLRLLPRLQNFKPLIAATSEDLKEVIKFHKPDVVVFCNSKIFGWDGKFISSPPHPKPLSVSIDSNWLFFPESPYPSLPWLDKYFINIPEPVFKLGLKEFGGNYAISEDYKSRIKIVGLIPSYRKTALSEIKKTRKKYKIQKDEKLIFLYTSIGGLIKTAVIERAVMVLEKLLSRDRKAKMIYIGDKNFLKDLNYKSRFFICEERKSTKDFYKILSSSDLVFQHQGLGTLAQAISAQVPVIANVKSLQDERSPYHAHAWEVNPFARYGACEMFYFNDPIDIIVDKAESLLYNKNKISSMKLKQLSISSGGEAMIFREILSLLRK